MNVSVLFVFVTIAPPIGAELLIKWVAPLKLSTVLLLAAIALPPPTAEMLMKLLVPLRLSTVLFDV